MNEDSGQKIQSFRKEESNGYENHHGIVVGPTKIGTRCPVCDQLLKRTDTIVVRENVTRVVFGKELPVRLHARCSKYVDDDELRQMLQPRKRIPAQRWIRR